MDIYRFFHPHHNPRLHSTPLRQQELSELEQFAAELRKAIERAQQRTMRKPASPLVPSHFTDVLKAMRFVESSLQTLCDAHEGDSRSEMVDLISERESFTGWDTWAAQLKEQLQMYDQYGEGWVSEMLTDHHGSSEVPAGVEGPPVRERKSTNNRTGFDNRAPIRYRKAS